MQTFIPISLLLGAFASISQGASIPTARFQFSVADIADATNKWAADTSKVSQFLSRAPILLGSDLTTAAQVALAAEKDELTHKSVLDQQFAANPSVQSAKNTLENPNNFQFVVDGLTTLSNGAALSAKQVSDLVDQINLTRCKNVLPAIDRYFSASSAVLQNGLSLVANRPNNCP
ncbi:Uu.00g009210.m01.CDS01 [Anthostomella pinea]|uniref:Uu.00g009210.m01.CDS01 n=1 Tax=Anthostomella pinea TaxID=933095 RepID=A0AAI8VXB1_9PEZI|nr:Uu.00g009210.m01.CDS01 [Anthostomella pinea]